MALACATLQSLRKFRSLSFATMLKVPPNLLTKAPAIEVISTRVQHSEPVPPVYELRTYTCHPHKLKDFLNITASEYHLRLKHSKPLGYWTSEIGGLNQVVHLWEYASLAHRDMVRASMAADSEWMTDYIAKVKPMWNHQENSLLTLLPSTTITLPENAGAYELQTIELAGPKCVWLSALQEYSSFCRNLFSVSGMSTLIGTWLTAIGPLNTVVLLWQHPEPDSVIPIKEKTENSIAGQLLWQHVRGGHTKLLMPHTNSPLR